MAARIFFASSATNHMNRVTTAHPWEGINTPDRLAGAATENPQGEPMSEFKQKEERELSRQQAAERLTDIAYALTAGDRLRLHNDEEVDLAIADRVTLKRESRSRNGRVELGIELSWPESPSVPPSETMEPR